MKKLLILLIIFSSITSISIAQKGNEFSYNPQGTEYTIVFPDKPKIKEKYIKLPGGDLFNYQEAQYIDEELLTMLTAETVPLFNNQLSSEEIKTLIIEAASNYAEAKGLSNVGLEYEENSLGKVATFTGYKKIEGIMATVGGKFIMGAYSSLCISYLSPSNNYPTKPIMNFIDSITR